MLWALGGFRKEYTQPIREFVARKLSRANRA
jgi:hypothetical protein